MAHSLGVKMITEDERGAQHTTEPVYVLARGSIELSLLAQCTYTHLECLRTSGVLSGYSIVLKYEPRAVDVGARQ